MVSAPRTTAELVAALRSMASVRNVSPADLLDAADRLEQLAPLELAAREFARAERAYLELPESARTRSIASSTYARAHLKLMAAAREVTNG